MAGRIKIVRDPYVATTEIPKALGGWPPAARQNSTRLVATNLYLGAWG
jgi:hypothetical protein